MIQKILVSFYVLMLATSLHAQQNGYQIALQSFQQDYLQSHEVVKNEDRKFVQFFPIDEYFRITAAFTKLNDSTGFKMKTSGTKDQTYFRYGKLLFNIHDTTIELTLYQSQQLMGDSTYQNYLFLPFTDVTSGEESYGGGRYIDIDMARIRNNKVVVDFNKAYNPYCAYSTGYNCPIPPRENDMPVAIRAGEMDFLKQPAQ